MRSRTHAIGFGLLLATATVTTSLVDERSARAQTAKEYPAACASVPASESERAHTLYGAGKAYYDDGNYEQAIAQFREAYKKDCSKHELLIIISRSYELHNERAEAIKALELYLERSPNALDTQQQKTRIENLKRELAKERAAAAAAAAGPAAPKQEIREHTIPPWIVVGLGGATVIVGVVVLVTSPDFPAGCSKDNESCSKDPTGKETEAAFKKRQETAGQAKQQPVYGIVTMGAGAILVAGGLLWHFLEPTGPVDAAPNAKLKVKPKLTPQIGQGYGGLSLGGTF